MKNGQITTFVFFVACCLATSLSFSQVTLDCESGSRAIDQGNCWAFGATTYSNATNYVISGAWSTRSNPLTNQNPTACWIKTPWMLVGSGNITLQSRLDGNGNGVQSKTIQLYYIPYDANASNGEGTPVLFHTYNFPSFNVTTIRDIAAPIPPEIAGSSSAYRFRVSFIGQGGNERAYSDNLIFPGTYWSDPSNSCSPMATVIDADGDGVPDSQDGYPQDPYRAFNNYYPSQNGFGTLAFEDSWPFRSDYDMNDLVVNYKFNTVTNASNNIVEVIGKVITRASGASYENAFGFQLDGVASSKITSVSGNSINPGTIFQFQGNGLEAGQTYANCIVFDDFFKVMQHPGTGSGINTSPTAPAVAYDTITVTIVFINNGVPPAGGTVNINELSSIPYYNFYIVADQVRGNEIHLADRIPTNLANTNLFGTGIDDTNPSQGKYYKTTNNLPWAINVIQGLDYPNEKSSISEAYLHFIEWAESSGALYPDWYANLPGYRDASKIY